MHNQHHTTAPEDRIPRGQKIAFGVGMLGNQMFPAALSIFMVVLVQSLGMDPIMWGKGLETQPPTRKYPPDREHRQDSVLALLTTRWTTIGR